MKDTLTSDIDGQKFADRFETADGQQRVSVALTNPKTLWFNTGTVCNFTCENCYIESSPTNDRLVYFTEGEVRDYLDQLREQNWPVTEIGFTGGEPFMNTEMCAMAGAALDQGYEVLILTNVMRPMMRSAVQDGLLGLNARFPNKLTLRISVDHYARYMHDKERGVGRFD